MNLAAPLFIFIVITLSDVSNAAITAEIGSFCTFAAVFDTSQLNDAAGYRVETSMGKVAALVPYFVFHLSCIHARRQNPVPFDHAIRFAGTNGEEPLQPPIIIQTTSPWRAAKAVAYPTCAAFADNGPTGCTTVHCESEKPGHEVSWIFTCALCMCRLAGTSIANTSLEPHLGHFRSG